MSAWPPANSGIRYPVFFIGNAISCAAWATAVGGLAFVSSQSVAAIIARMAEVQKIGLEAAGLLVGGAIVIMLVRWLAGRLHGTVGAEVNPHAPINHGGT